MYGNIMKPAQVSIAMNRNARRWSGWVMIAQVRATGCSSVACSKWPRKGGVTYAVAARISALNPASTKKGTCQLYASASERPIGTPIICETEKADITTPIAAPRRSMGMTSPTMERITAPTMPPNNPATQRAATSKGYVGDSAQRSVPTVNPAYNQTSAFFRSNRSMKNPPASPESPAANPYAETITPNCFSVMWKLEMYCGPSGMMMTKSRMVVKLIAASVSISSFSRVGVQSRPPGASCSLAFIKRLSPSRNQNDFARCAGFHDELVSLCRVRQRQLFAHDRTQCSVLEAGDQRGMNAGNFLPGCGREWDSEHDAIAAKRVTSIDLHRPAAADDGHAPAFGD